MAKLNRERKLRERRFDKQAKKDARKQALHQHGQSADGLPIAEVQSIPHETDGPYTASDPSVLAPAEV